MADWYLLTPGDTSPKGPGTTEQLRESLADGQIPTSSQVCRVGESTWISIAAVPEFRDAVRRAAPPPPMPGAAQPWSGHVAQPAPTFVPVPMHVPMRMPTSTKSRALFIVLALFLGTLGIHNFYAGYAWRGAAQLLITLLIGWTVVPLFFVGLWAIIECFAVTSDAQGAAFQ